VHPSCDGHSDRLNRALGQGEVFGATVLTNKLTVPPRGDIKGGRRC